METSSNVQKPLPLLIPDLLSEEDQEAIQRQEELFQLERLHELQRHEQYQRRQEKLYRQQGGIFHSNFDAESHITSGNTTNEEKRNVMHEYILVLRGVQGAFSILVLSFTAYVIHWWTKFWASSSPLEFSFLLYLSVQTLLSLAYVLGTQEPSTLSIPDSIANKIKRFYHPYAVFAIDTFLVICYFAGSIGLGVFLQKRVCYGTVCNLARASTAFSVLQFLLFLATTVNSGALSYRKWRNDRMGRHGDPSQSPRKEEVVVYVVRNEKNGARYLDSARYPMV